nr:hypothetical protein [Escherichia coli]
MVNCGGRDQAAQPWILNGRKILGRRSTPITSTFCNSAL